jgi:hypothetical protein
VISLAALQKALGVGGSIPSLATTLEINSFRHSSQVSLSSPANDPLVTHEKMKLAANKVTNVLQELQRETRSPSRRILRRAAFPNGGKL